jgi:hypothetical protein
MNFGMTIFSLFLYFFCGVPDGGRIANCDQQRARAVEFQTKLIRTKCKGNRLSPVTSQHSDALDPNPLLGNTIQVAFWATMPTANLAVPDRWGEIEPTNSIVAIL